MWDTGTLSHPAILRTHLPKIYHNVSSHVLLVFQIKGFQQISSPKFSTDSPGRYKIEYLVSLKMEALGCIATAMTASSLTHTSIDSNNTNNGCNQSRCYVSC
jgi:hypothetical protein